MHLEHLEIADPTVFALVAREAVRQEEGLEMIASENLASRAVMEAMGTLLTNKYAEGYPGKRYYGGCEVVDVMESLAISRLLELFPADHANVQPHSGAQANMAAYFATLEPGQKVLGMALPHGGHLTHGSPVNFSGRLYEVAAYGVDESTGYLDMDRVRDLARRERPNVIVAGASAYPRVIDFKAFAEIAHEVGARLIVDMAHYAGLIAGGVYPSPVPHADIVTSTTHKTLRGPRGGFILSTEEFAKEINRQVFPGMQGGPLEHVIAAKAVAFGEALQPSFREYVAQVVSNARVLAESLLEHGFHLVSGGTDCHLVLVDLTDRELTGKAAEEALGRASIHVNKNTVPGEKRSPFVTSGIRIGTPALTTRGMCEPEMKRIAGLIARVLENHEDGAVIDATGGEVQEMAHAFPIYQEAVEPAGS